jgi:hypothetical protein
MTRHIEDQVRRYTEVIDSLAPSVEELLPAGLAEEFGLEPRAVEVTATPTRVKERRQLPGWAVGLAAAVVVAALLIPLTLWFADDESEVVDTPPPTPTTTIAPVPTTAPTPPDAAVEPSLQVDVDDRRLTGSGWAPDTEISVTWAGDVTTSKTDDQGRFALPLEARFGECCFSQLTVTDGSTTRVLDVPHLEMTRVDPSTDVIVGKVSTPRDHQLIAEISLIIRNGDDVFETTVSTDGSV